MIGNGLLEVLRPTSSRYLSGFRGVKEIVLWNMLEKELTFGILFNYVHSQVHHHQ